jgi:hypothetical protein
MVCFDAKQVLPSVIGVTTIQVNIIFFFRTALLRTYLTQKFIMYTLRTAAYMSTQRPNGDNETGSAHISSSRHLCSWEETGIL